MTTTNPMQQIRELGADLTAYPYLDVSVSGPTLRRKIQLDVEAQIGARILAILDNPDWVCVPREPTHAM